ncbi:MAG: cbb3-type cytochrome c oxidase subunit 3 [Bacteroidales bacterium]|jgi:cbb3-type cytochrome oxidase subunit 3|nr:cbb3-type cytochrome c oxidase subunit 3 [Bacteroidales bacterium]
MNLVKEYLVSIAGVHIYAIISMLIFLVVFIFMIYHAYSLRKDDVRNYSQIPLDEEIDDQR